AAVRPRCETQKGYSPRWRPTSPPAFRNESDTFKDDLEIRPEERPIQEYRGAAISAGVRTVTNCQESRNSRRWQSGSKLVSRHPLDVLARYRGYPPSQR